MLQFSNTYLLENFANMCTNIKCRVQPYNLDLIYLLIFSKSVSCRTLTQSVEW